MLTDNFDKQHRLIAVITLCKQLPAVVLATGDLLATCFDAKNSRPQNGRQHRFTASIRTNKNAFNAVFWTQVFCTELQILQKADSTFCSDTAILRINNCCRTISDWSVRVSRSWLAGG